MARSRSTRSSSYDRTYRKEAAQRRKEDARRRKADVSDRRRRQREDARDRKARASEDRRRQKAYRTDERRQARQNTLRDRRESRERAREERSARRTAIREERRRQKALVREERKIKAQARRIIREQRANDPVYQLGRAERMLRRAGDIIGRFAGDRLHTPSSILGILTAVYQGAVGIGWKRKDSLGLLQSIDWKTVPAETPKGEALFYPPDAVASATGDPNSPEIRDAAERANIRQKITRFLPHTPDILTTQLVNALHSGDREAIESAAEAIQGEQDVWAKLERREGRKVREGDDIRIKGTNARIKTYRHER